MVRQSRPRVIKLDAIGDRVRRVGVAVQTRSRIPPLQIIHLDTPVFCHSSSRHPIIPSTPRLRPPTPHIQHNERNLAEQAKHLEAIERFVCAADHHTVGDRPVRAAAAVA